MRTRLSRLLACGAVGMASAVLPVVQAPPAGALSAIECVLTGSMFMGPGISPVPFTGGPPGNLAMSSAVVPCAGTITGLANVQMAANYIFTGLGYTVNGAVSMDIGGFNCGTSSFSGSITGLELLGGISTANCGSFTVAAQLFPSSLSGTLVNGAGVFGTMTNSSVRTGACSWVNASGCSYEATGVAAAAVVVSPAQPTVSGATASWTQVPIVGTGTSAWLGNIAQTPGANVSVSAAAGTSGAVVTWGGVNP